MTVRAITRTHKVTIRRATGTTRVKGGGRVPNDTVVGTDVGCNLQPRRGDLRQSPSGLVLESAHVGYFEPDADILPNDLVEVTDGAYSPTKLRVESIGVQGDPWDMEITLEEDRGA